MTKESTRYVPSLYPTLLAVFYLLMHLSLQVIRNSRKHAAMGAVKFIITRANTGYTLFPHVCSKMYEEQPYCTQSAARLLGSSHLQRSLLLAAAFVLDLAANHLPSAWRQAWDFLSLHYLEQQASLSVTPLGPTVLPDPLARLPWQRKSQQT